MTTTGDTHQSATITTRAVHGGLAGLVGGIVFGMMMAMMGMLTAVSESSARAAPSWAA